MTLSCVSPSVEVEVSGVSDPEEVAALLELK